MRALALCRRWSHRQRRVGAGDMQHRAKRATAPHPAPAPAGRQRAEIGAFDRQVSSPTSFGISADGPSISSGHRRCRRCSRTAPPHPCSASTQHRDTLPESRGSRPEIAARLRIDTRVGSSSSSRSGSCSRQRTSRRRASSPRTGNPRVAGAIGKPRSSSASAPLLAASERVIRATKSRFSRIEQVLVVRNFCVCSRRAP